MRDDDNETARFLKEYNRYEVEFDGNTVRYAKWMLQQDDVDDIKKARIKRELRAMGEME